MNKLFSKISNRRRIRLLRRKSNSIISIGAHINKETILEGHNKIGKVNICFSKIGYGSYILSGNLSNCVIGRFSCIGNNVKVLTAHHPINNVSMHPGFYKTKNKDVQIANNDIDIKEDRLCEDGKASIIGNDVWIGDDVNIIGGVTIGDGAVVGANSLVTKDVPPFAVVGGVPAKVIKYRFNKTEIDELNKIKWWNWDINKIVNESQNFGDIHRFLENNKK